MWNVLGLMESMRTQGPSAHSNTQVLCLYLKIWREGGTGPQSPPLDPSLHCALAGYLKNHKIMLTLEPQRVLHSGTVPGHQQQILNFRNLRNGEWQKDKVLTV